MSNYSMLLIGRHTMADWPCVSLMFSIERRLKNWFVIYSMVLI